MLIRSQDKVAIVNLDNVDSIVFADGSIYSYNGNASTELGEYSTEAKVIKVLDMICNEYKKYASIQKNEGVQGLFNYPKVFQMPQDSEVEE